MMSSRKEKPFSTRTYLPIVIIFLVECSRAQNSGSIVFVGTTAAPAPTTTKSPGMCSCVPAGMCKTVGIDVRIVNTGVNCLTNEVYCCQATSENNVDMSCGKRKIQPVARPHGQASFGSYPWQVALLTPANVYIGSGVLINPNHVLTVAHKVAAYTNGAFKVRLGEWDASNVNEPLPYVEFTPTKVFVHPAFNSQNLQNDVAVIRLNGNAPTATANNINTACVSSVMPPAGTRCWVSGWGKNAFGNDGSFQSIQKEVDVPVVSQAECETRMRATRLGQFFILDRTSFMCAGGEAGKDACTGDGGSPLVCEATTGQWQLVGMVAWGIGCAGTGVPGVYVNVPNFVSWINQQVSSA